MLLVHAKIIANFAVQQQHLPRAPFFMPSFFPPSIHGTPMLDLADENDMRL